LGNNGTSGASNQLVSTTSSTGQGNSNIINPAASSAQVIPQSFTFKIGTNSSALTGAIATVPSTSRGGANSGGSTNTVPGTGQGAGGPGDGNGPGQGAGQGLGPSGGGNSGGGSGGGSSQLASNSGGGGNTGGGSSGGGAGGGANSGGSANTVPGTGQGAGGPGDGNGPGQGAGQGLGPSGGGGNPPGPNPPGPNPPGPNPPGPNPPGPNPPGPNPPGQTTSAENAATTTGQQPTTATPNPAAEQAQLTATNANAAQQLAPSTPSVFRNGVVELGAARNTAGSFSYQVPAQLLIQANPNVNLVAPTSASTPGGRALPQWLTYQPTTRTFTANQPPSGSLPFRVEIRVGTNSGQPAVIPVQIGEP